jgi:hypothetical protein
MRAALLLAGLALLAAFPAAQGHGLVNAGELEVLMVQDEASDIVTGADYGYDLVQLYVGEAYVPGLGDGFYVHTVLYGGAGDRPAIDGPQTVAFEFTIDGTPIARSLTTTDGQTFEGDFDQMDIVPGDGEVEVQRAFVLYPEGVGPGSVLTAVRATTMVNDQPRDVAPGGIYLPGGEAEVPMGDSEQVVESYTFTGPVGYVRAELEAMTDWTFQVLASSLLKEGKQHIMLPMPADTQGWTVRVDGGGEVEPGGTTFLYVQASPGEGSGPLRLHLLTDIGGHVEIVATSTPEGVRLATADSSVLQVTAEPQEAPLAAWLVPLALGAALLARRVKG